MNDTTTLARVNTQEITEEYQQAVDLHHKIIADIETAAAAMIDLCQNLKNMRDGKLYAQLGYESFEDYAEKAVGIKRRQAYNYITVLEKLPGHLLESNAHLGITKLELLTQVPALEREEFVGDNDLDGISTRQMKELVEQVKQQGEQLSMLDEENRRLKERNTALVAAKLELDAISEQEDELSKQIDEKDAELDRLRRELEELASRPIEVAVQEPDQHALDTARKEAAVAAKKEAEEKLKKKIAKADEDKSNAEAALAAAERERDRIKQEQTAMSDKIKHLEGQLVSAGSQTVAVFKTYFESVQVSLNKMLDCITNSDDAATRDKLSAALRTLCEKVLDSM